MAVISSILDTLKRISKLDSWFETKALKHRCKEFACGGQEHGEQHQYSAFVVPEEDGKGKEREKAVFVKRQQFPNNRFRTQQKPSHRNKELYTKAHYNELETYNGLEVAR